MCDIVFRQLSNSVRLRHDDRASIARLIYQTDRYIYPALFGSEKKATNVISAALEEGRDAMFNLDRIYAMSIDGDIVGIILWIDGLLAWGPSSLLDAARRVRTGDLLFLDLIKQEYFDSYSDPRLRDTASILNVSVRPECRGRGLGSLMFGSFLESHPDRAFGLNVLADNLPALRLYEKHGFRSIREYPGFSLDEEKPLCVEMAKEVRPGSFVLGNGDGYLNEG